MAVVSCITQSFNHIGIHASDREPHGYVLEINSVHDQSLGGTENCILWGSGSPMTKMGDGEPLKGLTRGKGEGGRDRINSYN